MRLIRLLKNDLAKESAEWVEKEIISEQQAVAICNEYGTDYYAREQNNFLLNVLVGIGFLFIGIALIVLIGNNWENIPRGVRMFGLIAITVVTQCIGWRQYQKNQNILFFLLGNLFYGASIILIAQVYHLGEHMPDGVFWWALGSLPFALLTRSTWLMLFTLTLSVIWFFVEAHTDFIPWLFPVFVLSALWVLHNSQQTSLLLLIGTLFTCGLVVDYSFGLVASLFYGMDALVLTSGVFQYEPLGHFSEELLLGIALMILFYAVSVYLGTKFSNKAKDYAVLMRLWVLRFSVVLLFSFSFSEMWREFLRGHGQATVLLLVYLALLLIPACYLAFNTSRSKAVMGLSASVFFLTALLALAYVLLAKADTSTAVIFKELPVVLTAQILTNVLAIVVAVVLIIRGISEGVRQYFFLGILLIIAIGFARYFDLIGGYIGASILFLFFSFLLLGAAKFWKNKMAKQGLDKPRVDLQTAEGNPYE